MAALGGEGDAGVVLECCQGVDGGGGAQVVRAGAGHQPGRADLPGDHGRVGEATDAQGEVEALIQQRDYLVAQVQLDIATRCGCSRRWPISNSGWFRGQAGDSGCAWRWIAY